jgi:hypothetical protein
VLAVPILFRFFFAPRSFPSSRPSAPPPLRPSTPHRDPSFSLSPALPLLPSDPLSLVSLVACTGAFRAKAAIRKGRGTRERDYVDRRLLAIEALPILRLVSLSLSLSLSLLSFSLPDFSRSLCADERDEWEARKKSIARERERERERERGSERGTVVLCISRDELSPGEFSSLVAASERAREQHLKFAVRSECYIYI